MPRLSRRALLLAASLCSCAPAPMGADSAEPEPPLSPRLSRPRVGSPSPGTGEAARSAQHSLPFSVWQWVAGVSALVSLGWGLERLARRAFARHAAWVEQKVRERTSELERASAAKTEFVARIHHDIRNPINGVLGLAVALEDTKLTEEQRRLAATIRQCATFLSALADEVLDFAAVESGQVSLRPEPFEVADVLDAAIATASLQLTSAGCKAHTKIDPKMPKRLHGDAARIQQILLNFLTNAAKFSPGGEIVLIADRLHATARETVVRFAVSDQGPGVPADEQAVIFHRFRQGRLAIDGRIKGAGLGLATARMLAERMGGRVGMENNPGKGACFRVELPLANTAAEAAGAASPRVAATQRALVVEDEEYNAISLTGMLRKLGYRVDHAPDGVSGLEHLRRNRYDVAFIDCELPGMSGMELARQFRSRSDPGSQTLLVATTAYSSPRVRQSCLEAGMDAFLPKPLTPAGISAAVSIGGGSRSDIIIQPVVVQEEPEEPDFRLLDYLADGNPAVLRAKAGEFIASCERELADLEAVIVSNLTREIYPPAHRFLGHCRFIRAGQLAAIAEQLQSISPEAPSGTAARLFARLTTEFEVLRKRLQSHLSGRELASGRSRSQT